MSKFTKLEREYVKGIVHNLSFQRFSDQEIVQWLKDEKQIKIGRSTVTTIRNQAEKDATNWYVGLRESGSRYVAIYKERLDSLLSYQKKLHEIIAKFESSPEVVLRAISELHRIEISLYTLLKELPGDIKTSLDKEREEDGPKKEYLNFDDWRDRYGSHPRVSHDSDYSDEENGKYYWDLHKRYNEYVNNQKYGIFGHESEAWTDDPVPKSIEILPSHKVEADRDKMVEVKPEIISSLTNQVQVTEPIIKETVQEPKTGFYQSWKLKSKDTIDVDLLGYDPKPFDVSDDWVQCKLYDCNKWFKNEEIRQKHAAKYHV